jgi:hypothetical protein
MYCPRSIASYLAFGAAVLLAACSQMKPAQQALDDINNAVEAVPADDKQYIPDQFADVERKLADLNAFYEKKQYAAVLADAPALLFEAKGLPAAAATKKDEAVKALDAQWNQLSASVPQMLTSLKTRLEGLSKSRRAPKGMDLAAANTGLEDATVLWEKAQAAFQSKQIEGAVAAAKNAMSKAEATESSLKMSSP